MALSVNVIAARLGNCVKIAPSSRPLLMLSPHLDHDMATFPPSLVTYVNIATPSAAYWRRLGTLNDAANETQCYLIARLRLIVTSNINVARSQPHYNPRARLSNGWDHWKGTEQWLNDTKIKIRDRLSTAR